MPREDFYEGLSLSEQLRKLADYHHHPDYRHISSYEAGIIDRAAERLAWSSERARAEAEEDLIEALRQLPQLYETTVYGFEAAVQIESAGAWALQDAPAVLQELGLERFLDDPTDMQVQALLTAFLRGSAAGELPQTYADLIESGRELMSEQAQIDVELLNRVLYLPTIVAENSPPILASLLEHLQENRGKGAPVACFIGGVAVGASPIVAFVMAGGVIVLQLSSEVADAAKPGLRRITKLLMGEYEERVRRRDEDTDGDDA